MERRNQLVQERIDLDRQINVLKERRKSVQDQIDEIDNMLVGQQEMEFNETDMTSITDHPQVKELTEKFDLEVPKSYRCEVKKWQFGDKDWVETAIYQTLGINANIDAGDFIIITEVDVYDTDGNFVKTADLKLLQNTAHQFTFTFKKQS